MSMKQRTFLAKAVMTLLFAVLGSTGAWADDVVTIGTAQTSTNQLPTNQYYSYGVSQQIYTSSEINHAAGVVSSIAFNTVNGPSTRNLTIYMTTTTKASFDNNKDFVAVTEADIVFSGDVTFEAGQWNTIDLDSPFSYDGTSNILVTVDDNTGDYASSDGFKNYVFDASAQAVYVRDDGTNFDPTALSYPSYISPKLYDSKNQIQLGFEAYPKPSNATVSDIGDVSARVSCTLLGATAWNLRYRKVAGEGESEQDWTIKSNLTDPSFLITGLTAFTKYEAQLQAVYPEDNLSSWSRSLVFNSNCCPVEEQAEIIYAVNSNYSDWFGYAIQFVDITDEKKPIEVAYINPPSYKFTGGALTLCCGHKYQVNWIFDKNHPNVNESFSLSLYFEPGDLFYSMAMGEAPTSTSELTTFVMDCTPYCTQMPQNVSVAGTTFNSATLSFVSQTTAGEVVYSTEADFNPDTATPTSLNFTALPASDDPWGGTPDNASLTLTGLEPLTSYYVQVRSVCIDLLTGEPKGRSRWSEPIKVTTGSRYDAPTQIIAEPKNSRTEKLSWAGRGNEKGYNLYYRAQAAGNPVDPSAIETFGGGNGKGFENGSWGEDIWSSYGDRPFSNTIFVTGIPAGSNFGFKAGNGKTGAGQVKFLYGMKKKSKALKPRITMKQFDMKCLNDIDRSARIKQLESLIWAGEEAIKSVKNMLDEGTITQEKYDEEIARLNQNIAEYREDLETLKALPTDAQKLTSMKELESSLASEGLSQEERKSKQAELNELRAITINAENPEKDGFTIAPDGSFHMNNARGTRAADDDDTYIFFIRHSDPNGVLLVKDIIITPPEQVGEWTCIPNITGTGYMLTGLEPNTAYEVMVEPIYEDGTTGSQSPITVFTTIGIETDPSEGVFTVSEDKKVNFAKGNLRYSGDIYEGTWSIAPQQYEVLGEKNIEEGHGSSWPASPTDLLCWSTAKNHYGVSTYYYYDYEEANPYFKGDFVDWGENPALIADLGAGWSTLSKDEWNYLLNERENAAQLKTFATIVIDEENNVKGLVLLPDEWNAPDGVMLSEEMTAAQWATIEQAGAIFLPVTGHLWVWKDEKGNNQASVNGLDVIGNYWSSTPSNEDDLFAFTTMFNLNDSRLESAEMERRLGCAVRLVKVVNNETDLNNIFADGCLWATYVAEESLTTPDGLQAYVVSEATTTEVTATPVDYIPAGVAVLLNRTEASVSDYKAKPYAGEEKAPVSLLIGSATESTGLTPYKDFVLFNDEFVLSSTSIVSAGHAYLPVTSVPTGARNMIIVIESNLTGIKSVERATIDNDAWYTIDGRRLNHKPAAKGLYIHHNKKFVIK